MPETVAQGVSCGPSPERHLEAIDRFIQAGYDHIILVQVGPDQDGFFDLFERYLAHPPCAIARRDDERLGETTKTKAAALTRC